MKRAAKWLLAAAVIALITAYGSMSWIAKRDLASPAPEALSALVSDDAVHVLELERWLVMQPANGEPKTGVILYPGANCDIRGYAPVLRGIAAEGYLVVAVAMPFNRAVFAPDRADEVRAAFPDIQRWVITGHSLGGAMASRYALHHQDELAGLVIWDSRPPESSSLAGSTLPVVHIHRATPAGEPPSKFDEARHLFPRDSEWIPIPGGIHMYFGSFEGGGYTEEWQPRITRSEQHALVTQATLSALARMSAR